MFPNSELEKLTQFLFASLQSHFQSYNFLQVERLSNIPYAVNFSYAIVPSRIANFAMALAAEEIKATKLFGTDLVIAYALSLIFTKVADDGHIQVDGSHWIWKEQRERYITHHYF